MTAQAAGTMVQGSAAKALNLVLFQLCWVACVWSASSGVWWIGVSAVAAFAALETWRAPNRLHELRLLAVVAVLGFAIDSGYLLLGLLEFASPEPFKSAAPAWIVALWVNFTLTLNRSLVWLQRQPLLAALLGLIGGALSYWVAIDAWSAGRFLVPMPVALAVIAVVWAIATPLLFALARRLAPGPAAETGP